MTVQEQTIGFDIRLDATDKLDDGDTITEQFGIAPQIATLELMVYPKDESVLAGALSELLGKPTGFSFTRSANPPLILFIFGRKRVLPVNINVDEHHRDRVQRRPESRSGPASPSASP